MVNDRGQQSDIENAAERLRLLLAHVGDAVFMVDPQGRVVTWTPAAERILGYPESEALALSLDDFFPSDQKSRSAREVLELALASGRCELDDWRIAHRGRRFWSHSVTCPIYDAEAQLLGFAQILQDRSELREAQELLSEQARELQRSNADLEAFASIAAHDLQEPLRKLRTFADRLDRRFHSSLDEGATHLLTRMVATAARMQNLIDDLLSYSSLTRSSLVAELVSLDHVVAAAVEELSPALDERRGRVETKGLPTLQANPIQMRQLFQNLISNAVKFAREGVPPVVTLTAAKISGDAWEIRVEDNGEGFGPEHTERVFGLFQRLHGRTEQAGSGMGLAICRRIAEHHGGSITATAREGQGAAFTLLLPESPPCGVRAKKSWNSREKKPIR